MTTSRLAAYIGGASLLLAWLASASGVTRQPQRARATPPPADATVFQEIASDVQSQATRLRKRLASAPTPEGTVRNPFTFRARDPRVGRPTVRPVEPAVAIDPEPAAFEPNLLLAGVAEQSSPSGPVRTAMITGDGEELFMMTVGQTLLGRYRVRAIGADAVELEDTLTGATRRLALQYFPGP